MLMYQITFKLNGVSKTVNKNTEEEARYYIKCREYISGYSKFTLNGKPIKEAVKDLNNTKIEFCKGV
jgi:hypothetical protein